MCLDDIDELSLDAEDLLSFSYQVAKGMEYITSRNVRLLQTVNKQYIDSSWERFKSAVPSS